MLSESPKLWPMTCGLRILVGHYLRCRDKHIALISSAIISSRQTGAEPTKSRAACTPAVDLLILPNPAHLCSLSLWE